MQRIEIGDFLLIAEMHLGIAAEDLARMDRVMSLGQAALAAPFAGFGTFELFPSFDAKAAVYGFRVATYHALPDGNKRTALDVMIEFVERNGRRWEHVGGWERTADAIEGIAAGTISETAFTGWVSERIGPA